MTIVQILNITFSYEFMYLFIYIYVTKTAELDTAVIIYLSNICVRMNERKPHVKREVRNLTIVYLSF